ncbi:DNA cytosine methyltransferase [Achromobacter sp. F4_2707]|uniref:DNA cytosine methyltransferase n=1 Tax=Achromobacter sp. F4_2707 TaxID=3114286 RepID=UPI0039C749EC
MTTPYKPSLSCIDLFAGCGGLSLGLKEAGWSGVFAIERDPMAFETLSQNLLASDAPYASFENWPAWLPKTNHDIVTLLKDESMRNRLRSLRGTVTMMAGGPPCQGFSVGGRRDGTDERNSLVYQMLDMVELVRPRVVLIENVEGIARRFVARPGEASTSVADAVIERLSALGYTSVFDVLDASRFGVPQSRRRVVIVGIQDCTLPSTELKATLDDMLNKSAIVVRQRWGLHQTKNVTAKEAIGDLTGGIRVECPDSPEFESAVYTKAISAYARAMRKGEKTGRIPNSHRFSKHGERIQTLYKLAHQTQPPGRLSKVFLLENGTKKDKKVLIDPSAVVSTITTHPDEFIHYAEPRNITVREMARFQSFPDNFHFHGRYTINGPRRKHDVARCSQVGNAVPPLLAEGVGLALRNLVNLLDKQSTDVFPAPTPTQNKKNSTLSKKISGTVAA